MGTFTGMALGLGSIPFFFAPQATVERCSIITTRFRGIQFYQFDTFAFSCILHRFFPLCVNLTTIESNLKKWSRRGRNAVLTFYRYFILSNYFNKINASYMYGVKFVCNNFQISQTLRAVLLLLMTIPR